jgi:hypothetical protein
LEDAAPQFLWGASKTVDRTDGIMHQLVNALRAAVGEFSLRQRPNASVRFVLRRVGRKVHEVQAWMPAQELCQGSTVVR